MNDARAGSTVLITAGGSGIGRAMAEAFAATGARVWITDISQSALDSCPTEWQRDCLDVADPVAMSELFQRVQKTWGGLDTLCPNAGTPGTTAQVEDQDFTAFQRCLAVNLGGALLAAQGALPMMKAAGNGSIIFTGSPPCQ